MRRSALLLLPLLLIAGCGGGGGDPNPGGGGNPDVSELANVRTDAILAGSSAPVDATNVFVGERVQFRLTGIAVGGARQFVSVTGWTTSLPANVGTISSSGVFSAGPGTGSGTVSVTIDGVTYSGAVTVKGGAIATLTGRIRLVSGTAVAGVQIRILNASGGTIATGFSTSTGVVRIGVPNASTARRLNLNFDAVDPGANFYVRQFFLGQADYSTVIAGCTAPIPTLASGATATLPTDIVVYQLGATAPPPPPDGCTTQ